MAVSTPKAVRDLRDAYPLFPFYLVVDVSGSMGPALDVINRELPALRDAVRADLSVGQIARFGIVTFSDAALVHLPLTDLADVTIPTLSAQGMTNYFDVFDFLGTLIPSDIEWYKEDGYLIYRPVVFFLTDGAPSPGTPDWKPAHANLVDKRSTTRPTIVSFGFGNANEQVLQEVATYRSYIAEVDQPSRVLTSILDNIVNSIVQSTKASASGEAYFEMSDDIDGMRRVKMDLA